MESGGKKSGVLFFLFTFALSRHKYLNAKTANVEIEG